MQKDEMQLPFWKKQKTEKRNAISFQEQQMQMAHPLENSNAPWHLLRTHLLQLIFSKFV